MTEKYEIVVDEKGVESLGHPGGLIVVVNQLAALEQKIDNEFKEIKVALAALANKLPEAQSI